MLIILIRHFLLRNLVIKKIKNYRKYPQLWELKLTHIITQIYSRHAHSYMRHYRVNKHRLWVLNLGLWRPRPGGRSWELCPRPWCSAGTSRSSRTPQMIHPAMAHHDVLIIALTKHANLSSIICTEWWYVFIGGSTVISFIQVYMWDNCLKETT